MDFVSTPKQYIDAVKDCAAHIGSSVTFRGTIHRVRDMSDFSFVVVRVDRGLIQCTFQGDKIGDIARADIKDAMVVEVTGDVHEEPRAEHGFEVILTGISILAKPAEQLLFRLARNIWVCP